MPQNGAHETWGFTNLTDGTHPIRLHRVQFQIVGRRLFDLFACNAQRMRVCAGPWFYKVLPAHA